MGCWVIRNISRISSRTTASFRLAHGFHKMGFCGLGFLFFSFVSLQLLVLKPPALRQLSEGEKKERERGGKERERLKESNDKMPFCSSFVTFGRSQRQPLHALPHLPGFGWGNDSQTHERGCGPLCQDDCDEGDLTCLHLLPEGDR